MEKTSDATVIYLKFDKNFTDLFSVVPNISKVSISGLNSSKYNYTILKSELEGIFRMTIFFSLSMTKYPTLTLTLNLPFNIEYHPINRLTKREVSIMMKSYFKVSDETLSDTKKAAVATESGGYTTSAGAIVASLSNSGSGFAFRSLLLMDLIKFLKLIIKINFSFNYK